MATMKCEKCGSVLGIHEGKSTLTCPFCGTAITVPSPAVNESSSAEDLLLEKQYDQLVQKAKTYRDIKVLTATAEEFHRLGTYKDSMQMAEFCLNKVAEEEAMRLEEAKARELEEQLRQKRHKMHLLNMIPIYILAAALLIAFVVYMSQFEIKTYFTP